MKKEDAQLAVYENSIKKKKKKKKGKAGSIVGRVKLMGDIPIEKARKPVQTHGTN